MPLVRTAQALLIELKLPDKTSTVFPRARLFDVNNTELPASPVPLSHITDGLYRYTGTAIPMPQIESVTVIISVFDDAGFTEPSEDFADGVDLFELVDDFIVKIPLKKGSQLVTVRSKEKIGVEIKEKDKISVAIKEINKINVLIKDKKDISVSIKPKQKINITIKKGD